MLCSNPRRTVLSVRWGGRVLFILSLVLLVSTACSEAPPASKQEAEPASAATPSASSTEALPPAPEKVPCAELMEWIRFRPLSKACARDADCVLQRDSCCDTTAVNVTYSTTCQKTCKEECPQDSVVGQRLTQQAVCKNGSCDLISKAIPTSP